MGKASSSKKVARAASTGGGRTSRGSRPWGWYSAMAMVCVLGVVTVAFSRTERQNAVNPLKAEKPRAPSQGFGGDHWHTAYGIYGCDRFLPPIKSDKDPLGIHTHDDGVIHVHPFSQASAGGKATFGVFARTVGMKVGPDTLELPDGDSYKAGETCGGRKTTMRVLVDGRPVRTPLRTLRLRDRDLLVVAFAPPGAKVPTKPPSASQLDKLDDVGAQGSTTTAPPTTTTTAPVATSTTAPTTTAPTTTTRAPTTTTAKRR